VGDRHNVQGVIALLWHCHQVATGSSDTINIFGFRLSPRARSYQQDDVIWLIVAGLKAQCHGTDN
jgi:hypothetical protein